MTNRRKVPRGHTLSNISDSAFVFWFMRKPKADTCPRDPGGEDRPEAAARDQNVKGPPQVQAARPLFPHVRPRHAVVQAHPSFHRLVRLYHNLRALDLGQ